MNIHISKKQVKIGVGLCFGILILFGIYRLIPPSQGEKDQAAMVIEQSSYYQLEVDGKPTIFFADYKDNILIGGATNKDSIHMRRIRMKGYWVNQTPFVPTCFGRILTTWENKPAKVVNLTSDDLHRLLRREYIATDDKLAGLQTQRNELTYYMRVHSVQDFGYNKIADYRSRVIHEMDSLERVIAALEKVEEKSKLKIRQINRYRVLRNGKRTPIVCHRQKVFENGEHVLLQTADEHTPFSVNTKMSVAMAQDELKKVTPRMEKVLNKPLQVGTPDSLGYYIGELKDGKPNGYGQHYGTNGSFYDGHWVDGKRHGFGFYVAPHEYLMVGEWKDDICKGERLTHNGERIYGIDLSRHQHEIGKKVYGIDWNNMYITHLGKLSNKKIEGRVHYPVSFLYIKTTEGTTVMNAYYKDDYEQARKHNIRVGAYHFFSTTSAGAAQAKHFLANTIFRKGDLPPVLDVEPSDAQIEKMGGAEVMFKHVRDWLTIVHKRTGVRPVLYISQMFTKKYLPSAPDIIGNYFVWIARYGEYKPDIKLTYWQLSPDGKVAGVQGDVDINVFNGYRNQYEGFLKRYCVR